MRRLIRTVLLSVPLVLAGATPAFSQTDTSVPDPVVAGPTTTADPTVSTLAPDCVPPVAPDVVFVGRLISASAGTGTFVVSGVRSDPKGFLGLGRAVEVRIGADVRFLGENESYLVAAEHTPDNAFRSKVRQPLPVFGGDQVVGVDDFGAKCPALSDPIVVRNGDGSAIDTGVLTAFLDDRRGIALAILKPVLWVALGLVALWALKRLVVYATRGLGEMFRGR